MPSLRQLEYFLALAELRHFRRAAEKCGASQPTLSAQLRAMEDKLGLQLVERNRTGVILTAAGQQIVVIARRILRDVRSIQELSAALGGGGGGLLRMGLPPTIGPYLLPRMVPDLHSTYPSLKLYVREDLPKALPVALEDGRQDIIVMALPVLAGDLVSVPIFREPLYLAIPSDHVLASREKIQRRDLKGTAILTLESGHQLREQVEGLCGEVGAELQSDFEGTSLDTLREMVGMGMGLSFLPGLYVNSSLRQDPAVKVVTIAGPPIYRTIGMVITSAMQYGVIFRTLPFCRSRCCAVSFAAEILSSGNMIPKGQVTQSKLA
jgi:LysR family hydrogen peroxide-inducible transcriptional activator